MKHFFLLFSILLGIQTMFAQKTATEFIDSLYTKNAISVHNYKIFAQPLQQKLKKEALFINRGQQGYLDFEIQFGVKDVYDEKVEHITTDHTYLRKNKEKIIVTITCKNEDCNQKQWSIIFFVKRKKNNYLIQDIFYTTQGLSLLDIFNLIERNENNN